MSGAAKAVQAALVAALGPLELAVLDGLSGEPALPAAVIADATTLDWGTKDRRGREVRIAVAILADAGAPAVLHDLLAQAEDAIEAMPRDLPGYRVASVALIRSRIDRSGAVWAGRADYRVRVLEVPAP